MAAAGLGISFNQRLIAQKWDRHAVAQVPFSPPQFIELGIAVPSMREASPAAKKLSACAVRCIRRLTDQGAWKTRSRRGKLPRRLRFLSARHPKKPIRRAARSSPAAL